MTASFVTPARAAYSAGRWAAWRMGCPKADAPSTHTVRFRWGGRTGSHVSWALAGRRFEPSASTSTKSAAVSQPGKSGAVSLPSAVKLPAQAAPWAASAAVSADAVAAKGYWGGFMIWVVVASSTVP